MSRCDICGKKFKGSVLRYNGTVYCPSCRQQAEQAGNAPWNKILKPLGIHIGWWIGGGVVLLIGLIALIW